MTSAITRIEGASSAWNRVERGTQYLTGLRNEHFRKKRLLEILDTLSAKPIVKKNDEEPLQNIN